ncbi:hypothetical protein KR018_004337, partial [Drosophila ironensis]
ASKRKWLPCEEDRFIEVWYHNLHLFESGRKLVDIYRILSLHFREVGIEIGVQGIKSKMESIKRKYMNLYHSDPSDQSSAWRHYDTMSVIMGDVPKAAGQGRGALETEPQKKSTPGSPFYPGYMEECSLDVFKNEEGSRLVGPTTVNKKPQRASKQSSAPMKSRRSWRLDEEAVFLDVWEKYAMDILGERKNLDVYADMQSELERRGIFLKPIDIKAKIESLKRTFRVQRDTLGDKSEWIHYQKVKMAMNPVEFGKFGAPHNTDNTSSSEEDAPWISEPLPQADILPSLHCAPELQNGAPCHELADLELGPCGVDVIIESPEPHASAPENNPPFDKQKLTEEFSQFVTKELAVLNDDLLIEAKRRIYNVICLMQMKQTELRKKT